jgi:molybdopterin molybdotransferase
MSLLRETAAGIARYRIAGPGPLPWRVLAEDVVASMPLPPFDNSAMDGFAFRHADLQGDETALRLVGEQFAGLAQPLSLQPANAAASRRARPMPPGTDTSRSRKTAASKANGDRAGRRPRRERPSCRRGCGARDLVLRQARCLRPARVSLAASLGVASLRVSRKPTVAVFSTGDELVEPECRWRTARSTTAIAIC